jgi:hypothetical protein
MTPSNPCSPHPGRSSRWAWAWNLVVLIPVLPLLLQRGFVVQHDISMSDLLHSHLPFRAALGRIVASGHLPLWLPDVFGGTPLWAQIEAGAAFPPHILLFGLLDPYSALNLSVVLEILAATFGTWLLARRMKVEPRSAVLAGLAFAWCGFMVTHVRHPNIHAATALMPWVLWAGEGLLVRRGARGAVVLALLVALQVSAGHPQITYITLLVLAGRALCAWPGEVRCYLLQLTAVAAATGLGLGLMGALLLPSWAFTHEAMGDVVFDWDYATAFPLPPGELLGMIWPPWVGSMEGYDYAGSRSLPWGNYGFVGLTTLVLAAVGLVTGRARGSTRFLVGAAVLATLLALGPATPLFRLAWTVLPGADLFRFANRFLLVTQLALALLAAQGLATLAAGLGRRRAGLVALIPAAALPILLLDLDHHHRERLPMDAREHWDQPVELAALVGGLGSQGRSYTLDELDLWERAFHAAQGYRLGFEPYRQLWRVPLCSSTVMHGLRGASGYVRMLHYRTAAFWQLYDRPSVHPRYHPPERGEAPGTLDPRMRGLLDRGNVRLLFSASALEDAGLRHLGVVTLHVYENLDALPRAYLAQTWEPVEGLAGAARWMLQDGLDQPLVPALESEQAPSSDARAGVMALEVHDDGPNRLAIHLPAGHPGGLLVLTDSWGAGWAATVDGHAAALEPANGSQRGLRVEPGASMVRMRYVPPGLLPGLLVSLAAALGLLGWVLVAGVGRRRARGLRPAGGGLGR